MAFQTPQKQMSFSRELRMVLQERNLLSAKSREKVCSMLNDSNIATSTPKTEENTDRNRLRDFRRTAVLEIVNSEKTYLGQLELLMKHFVEPLKEKGIIDIGSHTLLFGQIKMIYNLNGEFLRELESDVDHVAQAFLKMAPFFKLYSVYAFDYRSALLVLQELSTKNQNFRKFLEQAETRPEVQQKLISLMIVPIQRVPRYKLLLQQVLYYTSPANPDFKMLRESIKQIEDTVSYINSCVEDQETTQMLINLQNSLCGHMPNIVKPSRKVIKEGILEKVTRNGTGIKRYCVLMSDIFMYCKILKERNMHAHVENSLECCCIFPLNKCKIYELLPGNFKITCQGDGLIFSTKDLLLQRAWVTAIRDAIESHLQCRKTLRKDSSKRTPLRRKAAKNFGNDYVLSPKAKKGDYEYIFRRENRSSESEASDDSDSKKNSCFRFTRWDSEGKAKGLERRRGHLKRRADSSSRDSCLFDPFTRPNIQSNLELEPSLTKFLSHSKIDYKSPTSILKPKPIMGNLNNIEYNGSRYGCGSANGRRDIFSHEELDDVGLTPPLKKRVKFDDSQCNVRLEKDKYAGASRQNFYGVYQTKSLSPSSEDVPLHQKVWNFLTSFF